MVSYRLKYTTALLLYKEKVGLLPTGMEDTACASSPEGSNAKRRKHCTFCKNHGRPMARNSHVCPFVKCECKLCQLSTSTRTVMKYQQATWRRQAREQTKNNEFIALGITSKQLCDKCRSHTVFVAKRGHKGACQFENCDCPNCKLTDCRRLAMKIQQRLRRANVTSEAVSSEEEDSNDDPCHHEMEDSSSDITIELSSIMKDIDIVIKAINELSIDGNKMCFSSTHSQDRDMIGNDVKISHKSIGSKNFALKDRIQGRNIDANHDPSLSCRPKTNFSSCMSTDLPSPSHLEEPISNTIKGKSEDYNGLTSSDKTTELKSIILSPERDASLTAACTPPLPTLNTGSWYPLSHTNKMVGSHNHYSPKYVGDYRNLNPVSETLNVPPFQEIIYKHNVEFQDPSFLNRLVNNNSNYSNILFPRQPLPSTYSSNMDRLSQLLQRSLTEQFQVPFANENFNWAHLPGGAKQPEVSPLLPCCVAPHLVDIGQPTVAARHFLRPWENKVDLNMLRGNPLLQYSPHPQTIFNNGNLETSLEPKMEEMEFSDTH